MPTTVTRLAIPGGITGLMCPITGIPVIDSENGFDSDALHSPHLRFFVDWAECAWAANPSDLTTEQQDYQKKVLAILASADDLSTVAARCAAVMPPSALVLEILDPPEGSSDGTICFVAFDLAGQEASSGIQLIEVASDS